MLSAHSETGKELGENKNIINALQERVSSVSGQLHQRVRQAVRPMPCAIFSTPCRKDARRTCHVLHLLCRT